MLNYGGHYVVQTYIQNETKYVMLITDECKLYDNIFTEQAWRSREFYISIFEERKVEHF